MILIEAAKQALEALDAYSWEQVNAARAALRAAIEQAEKQEPLGYWNAVEGWVELPEQEQKPAAWVAPEFWEHLERVNCGTAYRLPGEGRQPLYTTPPAAQRQPLTDEEIDELVRKNFGFITAWQGPFVRAIEAAHGIGEKNK